MIGDGRSPVSLKLEPRAVKAALQAHVREDLPALPGQSNHLRAGVLVPLAWDPEPICWLTLRVSSLRNHAGEICFPGGRPEPEDGDLEATACREAKEELGVSILDMMGRLSSMPLYTSDFRLESFVARVDPAVQIPDPAEVERVLPVHLLEVLSWPKIDAIPYDWNGRRSLSPVFVLDGDRMYGGTAHVFLELLQVLAPVAGLPMPPLVTGRFAWEDILEGPTPC